MPYKINPFTGRPDYYDDGSSGSGAGVTVVIPAGYPAIMAQGDSVVVEHPAAPNAQIVVNCMENIAQAGKQDIGMDFDLADESQYQQEDAVNGTDFVDGVVKLHSATTIDPNGANNTSEVDATSPSGTVIYSSQYNNTDRAARNAFNNSASYGTGWIPAGGELPAWVGYDFVSPKVINKYRYAGSSSGVSGSPKSYKIEASNDLVNWTVLHTVTNAPERLYQWVYPWLTFSNSTAYRYYRFYMTEYWSGWPNVEEMELVAAPATLAYPTTPKYIVTPPFDCGIKAASKIQSVVVTSTTPSGTSVKCLVSLNNGDTWLYHNGTSWQEAAGVDLRAKFNATSMTIAQMQAGMTNMVVGDEVIRFAFDLATTNTSLTPEISQVTVMYDQTAIYSPRNDNYQAELVDSRHTVITRTATGSAEVIPQVWVG